MPPEIQNYRLMEIPDVTLLRIGNNPQFKDEVRRQCLDFVAHRKENPHPVPPPIPEFLPLDPSVPLPKQRSFARGEERINEKNPKRKGNKRLAKVPDKVSHC